MAQTPVIREQPVANIAPWLARAKHLAE